VDALSRFEPLPRRWPFFAEFAVGRAYFLAGRIDESIPHLARASAACNALAKPFEHVQANLLLGQALESTRDVPGACKAYRAVLSRWGNAKPRSRTADAARARVNALSCP
jgi:serine/threonine-protein kinase